METIESAAELAAVSGGAYNNPLQNIKCTASVGPSCTGSLQDFFELAFGAFDQFQVWGGQLGIWTYDVTHPKGKR
jgi:hypothetical protein